MEQSSKTSGGLLPNDSLLAVCVVLLLAFLLSELWKDRGSRSKKSHTSLDSALLNPVPSSRFHVPLPFPVYEGLPRTVNPIQSTTALLRFLPQRQTIYESIEMEESEEEASQEAPQVTPPPAEVDEPLIGLPNQPGIEFNSQLVIKLHQKLCKEFPETPVSRNDVVRFLVARKGNVEAAVDMFRKAFKWHAQSLPLRATADIIKCLSSKCFFAHGVDREGAPVLYLRGALYDSKRGSPETYVLVAAHAIAHALRNSKHCAMTCMVHAVAVPGAANENTDINFIKGFVQTLSDNFPERLKCLAIYPFPWYGRAIWSLVKVFVDKRTQEKVLLVSGSEKELPVEITKIVDPHEIPECCGGLDKRPVEDIESTLLRVEEEDE